MIKIRRAAASEAKPLVGLYAESGRGKTKSALLLAKGFAGDMSRVVMVETESGRGEAYAADPVVGGYNVISLRESFSPKEYGAAIAEAERAKAAVLIIDSASHEWEGVGGVLAMAAKNQEDGKKGPLVWQRPKIDHAREFMLRLTQTPIPLVIVCMRAKFPMYEVTARHVEKWEEAGKPGGDRARPKVGEWARSWALEPKQSDDILFEMFVHGWIDESHALHITKYTLDAEMREVFREGEPITVETGQRLARWAAVQTPGPREPSKAGAVTSAVETRGAGGPDDEIIGPQDIEYLERLAGKAGIPLTTIRNKAGVEELAQMTRATFDRAVAWVVGRSGVQP